MERVQVEAERLGLSLTTRESNHEGTILDLVLNAQRPIVLFWNGTSDDQWRLSDHLSSKLEPFSTGRLSDSPMIVCALQAVAVPVILVSNSSSTDHGPLPSSVKGVLSGAAPASTGLKALC